MELQAVLNRMAGTTNMDAQGAANVICGTTQVELVKCLNVIAGTTNLAFNGAAKAVAAMYGGNPLLDANDALDNASGFLGGVGAGSPVGSPGNGLVAYWKADEYDATSSYLTDLTGRGHDARIGSVGSARIMSRGLAKYLRLPGVTGNYASVPDSAALDITGDMDLRARIAPDTWTPALLTGIISKRNSTTTIAYTLYLGTTGTLNLQWSNDGTVVTTRTSSVVVGFAVGTTKWVRATFDADDGASNNVVKFYTSDDGATWAQLGTTITTAGVVGTLYNSVGPLEMGDISTLGRPLAGKVYCVQIRNNVLNDGTGIVFDADFTTQTAGATSFTATTGQTVTINSTSSADTNDPTFLSYTGEKYAYLPGIAGNYLSSPDSAVLSIPGDITIDVKVAMDDWTPAAGQALVAKVGSTVLRSYSFSVSATTGLLSFQTSPDGSTNLSHASTAAPVVSDGSLLWLRVSMDVDDGAGNRVIKFYTSSDGVSWTQLGVTVTAAGATSLFDSSSVLELGSNFVGQNNLTGKIYRAKVYNGYLQGSSGTPVFDANLASATEPFATFTESSSNAATVTINRAATGKKTAIVDRPMFLFGTDDYMEVADQADLNFAAGDSFTLIMTYRGYGAQVNMAKFAKRNVTTGDGWYLSANSLTPNAQVQGGGGATTVVASAPAPTFTSVAIRVNRTTQVIDLFTDGVITDTDSTAAVGTLATTDVLTIGKRNTLFADFVFIGAVIFRRALTDTEIVQISADLLL